MIAANFLSHKLGDLVADEGFAKIADRRINQEEL